MREVLRGWYPPTPAEFQRLWNEAEFVVDANVLLNLYRYSERTREQFVETLEQFRERLWVPYQAALEYQRNRLTVIAQQRAAYPRLRDDLGQVVERVNAAVAAFSRHPRLDIARIKGEFTGAMERVRDYLTTVEDGDPDPDRGRAPGASDGIRDRLTTLLQGRVGEPLTDDELAMIKKAADERFARGIPPGYRDNDKPGDGKYGDYIIWEEVLRRSARDKSDVIFVTDDRKDDWWWIDRGRTIGPRPELVEEFRQRCDGEFYMYASDQFLVQAANHLRHGVSAELVGEVQAVAEQAARETTRARGRGEGTDYLASLERERERILRRMNELHSANPEYLLLDSRKARLRHLQREIRETEWRLARLDEEVTKAISEGRSQSDIRFLMAQQDQARAKLGALEANARHPVGQDSPEEHRWHLIERLSERLEHIDHVIERASAVDASLFSDDDVTGDYDAR